MTLLPLQLGVTRILYPEPGKGPAPQPVDETAARQAVLKRDGNSCRFCGFTSAKYQQIHFLNGNRRDWNHENLVTACIFCDQCFMLERIAPMRSGKLIWLPEISQAALHDLCRAIYVARISPGAMADSARTALEVLGSRGEEAKRRVGTDDTATLSMAFQDYLEDSDYKKRQLKLEGLRLMPLDRRIVQEADIEFNQFPQILAYWRSKDGPFFGMMPQKWEESFKDVVEAQREGNRWAS